MSANVGNILGKKCGREECLTYIFFLTKLTDQSVSDYRAPTHTVQCYVQRRYSSPEGEREILEIKNDRV